MNYYNPYFYTMPNAIATPKVGLFSRLFGNSGITFSGILNGTQRALNFANQAIPLVKQVKPLVGNAKTMFKVMNEFKKTDIPNNQKKESYNSQAFDNTNNNINNNEIINDTNEQQVRNEITNDGNGPTFFI